MPWQQVMIKVSGERAEFFADALQALGALSVTYQDEGDQPIYEPSLGTMPLWDQVTLSALFAVDEDLTAIQTFCQSYPDITWKITVLPDQDWVRLTQENVKPRCFAGRLWIVPTGYEVPAGPYLRLDPGLAFGTGSHPTTALCLEALTAEDLTQKTVVDYGCGSGILALAALALNAAKVYAVDHDAQALIATQDNATKNQIDKNKLVICLPEEFQLDRADVVIANILAGPLCSLSENLTHLCQDRLILSGILQEQAETVRSAYPQFSFQPSLVMEDWVCLIGKKMR